MQTEPVQQFTESLAREAGALLMRYQREGFDVTHKGRVDLVTTADRESERLIIGAVSANYPTHAIISEEEAGGKPLVFGPHPAWIIDPLDGTTGFVHGFPVFAVSLALYADGEPQVGVVYDPTRDELFSARRGGGATLNGRPIAVSQTRTLIESLATSGFPYDVLETGGNMETYLRVSMLTRGVRIAGAAALDLAWVACGRVDAYWEPIIKPWDGAAGALIVREAGGRVTDYADRPWYPGQPQVVATNGRLHALLRSELSAD
ncbi:MAG: inositol monophosphatase [Chloroflexi bacterium]|nr:inositol monophosphatase [Chloroflexota bacterium]